jgi:hypothetical protein
MSTSSSDTFRIFTRTSSLDSDEAAEPLELTKHFIDLARQRAGLRTGLKLHFGNSDVPLDTSEVRVRSFDTGFK